MFYSIIICTYNPDQRIFSRCLKAVSQLDTSDLSVERIIVDNNSGTPVSSLDYISHYDNFFRIIPEKNPGLANARITGVKASKGNVIVFVDDDNELDRNYLQNLNVLLQNHPTVGIWGPGKISVDFIDGATEWIKKFMLAKYQFKNLETTTFGCEKGWPSYYPSGSGFILKKEVFENYLDLFEKGFLTASGRKGESLASAEDSQIVWSAILKNIPVGTSPDLKLVHIIPAKRTTLHYLENLNFNLSHSFFKAQMEIFKDEKLLHLKPTFAGKVKLLMRCLILSHFNLKVSLYLYKVENAWGNGYVKFLNEYNSGTTSLK